MVLTDILYSRSIVYLGRGERHCIFLSDEESRFDYIHYIDVSTYSVISYMCRYSLYIWNVNRRRLFMGRKETNGRREWRARDSSRESI